MPVPNIKFQHHVNGRVDVHASKLMNLLTESNQPGLVPLEEGNAGVRGTRDHYINTASEIVAYALKDPKQCEKFLANMFLPSAEKMNLQRRQRLANL